MASSNECDDILARVRTNKVKCGSAIGITTFIAQSLRGGGGFYDTGNPIGSGKKCQRRGLQIGRSIDTLFQQHAASPKTTAAPRRVRAIFSVLGRLKIQVVSTQATVVDRRVGGHDGIKTRLDGLGFIKLSRTFVVIELKTTQRTYASHLSTYKIACRRHPSMLNGEPNSEFTSHQTQTGFGMRAFTNMYAPSQSVQGIVIVSCADGHAAFYHVLPRFTRDTVFSLPWARPRFLPKSARAGPFVVLERTDVRLREALATFGSVRSLSASADRKVYTAKLHSGKTVVCGLLAETTRWWVAKGTARLQRTAKNVPRVRRVLFELKSGGFSPIDVTR